MKKILCILLLLLTGCSSKTSMIEIQKHVYVEKEFKDSWLETNEFGDSYIKEELQGGYHYHFDQQFLEIFFNTGGKIELYNYSIKKNDLIISGEFSSSKQFTELYKKYRTLFNQKTKKEYFAECFKEYVGGHQEKVKPFHSYMKTITQKIRQKNK